MASDPVERETFPKLEPRLLNAEGEIASALPPRTFYIRTGNAADENVVREVFTERAYDVERFPGGEVNAIRLAERYAQICRAGKRPLIVDAGAMIGASAVYYQLIFPQSFVIAIEPERTNFALLAKNCSDLNVRTIEGAVASTNTSLFLQDPGFGHVGFQTADRGSHEVTAYSIDHIVGSFDRAAYEPFVCKINIEGGETELFARNVGWLDAFAAVVIELHDWMLPGQGRSRNFLRALSARNFDMILGGLDAFCFNNEILYGSAPGPVRLEGLRGRPEAALGYIESAMVTGLGDGRSVTARPLTLPPGSRLHLNGWAADPVARSAGAGLVVSVGTVKLDVSSGYGGFRNDVSAVLGANAAFDQSGFDIAIEASDLPAGEHELTLGVVGAGGEDYFMLVEHLDIIVKSGVRA
jgi:FkbM family methyltransferase